MFSKDGSFTLAAVAGVAVAVMLVLAIPVFGDNCTTYEDSEPTWFWGYGTVCAGHGNGCEECVYGSAGCARGPDDPPCGPENQT